MLCLGPFRFLTRAGNLVFGFASAAGGLLVIAHFLLGLFDLNSTVWVIGAVFLFNFRRALMQETWIDDQGVAINNYQGWSPRSWWRQVELHIPFEDILRVELGGVVAFEQQQWTDAQALFVWTQAHGWVQVTGSLPVKRSAAVQAQMRRRLGTSVRAA